MINKKLIFIIINLYHLIILVKFYPLIVLAYTVQKQKMRINAI
jgi:hypothetical protein